MSFDVDDLPSFRPQVAEWTIGVRILAGPADGPGEESFDLTVCSVDWLAAQVRKSGVFDGRHYLVVDGFDWATLSSYIERRVRNCEAPTWSELADRLGRLGFWEFEDYRP